MRNLIVALLCLFSASCAFANTQTNKNALELIKKIEIKQKRIKKELRVSQSLVKILNPEMVRQGDSYSIYLQSNTEVTGTNSLIDLTIDGNLADLEQPAKGLFIYHSNGEAEIKIHNAVAKLSIEDAAEAKSLRDAIQQLDLEIAALQDQIDEMEPGEGQDALISQRDEKVEIKGQLVAALTAIKTPIGEEAFSFRIIGAVGNNPNFFRIISVSPSFGPVQGGTELTVTGQRFPEGMEAILGGVSASLAYVSSTEVKITTPDFTAGASGGTGIKTLELRLPAVNPGDSVKNATRANVFYAANIVSPPEENVKPVAIAGTSQSVGIGSQVNMSGLSSYDNNLGTTLSYSWTPISVPNGSGISTGAVYSTDAEFSYTPTKPGSYVWELIVSDGELDSEPSLTVVTANPPTNSAPEPSVSSGITIAPEGSASVQVVHGDVDDYQAHSYLITKQSAFGAATVSSTGLVEFIAGNTAGNDSIEVAVVDNGTPPLSGTVSIPVVVALSEVSIGEVGYEFTSKDGLFKAGIWADPTTSSNGEIVSAIWSFGDGTADQSLDVGPDSAGDAWAEHDYVATGTYTATLTATDSLGATASKSLTVVVNNTDIPVVKVLSDVISGAVPLTVNLDASASSDAEGITSFRWKWADGSAQENTGSIAMNSHTFTEPGYYRVRVRAVDADNNQSQGFVEIYAGVTPPAEGSKPWASFVTSSREVVIGSAHAFDAGRSFDPNPSGSLSSYAWDFGDWENCGGSGNGCVDSGVTASHSYTVAKAYGVELKVTASGGGFSESVWKEVFAVNEGHAPRAVLNNPLNYMPFSGVAPFTANFDGSMSYDYDGNIAAYSFNFSDPNCTVDCSASTATASHTFSTADDAYFVELEVTDDDGNKHTTGNAVIVYPSLEVKQQNEQKMKRLKLSGGDGDHEREQKRRVLTAACFKNQAPACYEVGKMYEEDGNDFAAGKFFKKACALGYEAACSKK